MGTPQTIRKGAGTRTAGAERRGFGRVCLDALYRHRRKLATLAVAILAIFMGIGVVFGHNGLTVFAHKKEEASSLQRQMMQLRQENDRLRGHVDRLTSDPGAIEHQAREELHYTRADEVIYTLPAPPDASHASAAAPSGTRH